MNLVCADAAPRLVRLIRRRIGGRLNSSIRLCDLRSPDVLTSIHTTNCIAATPTTHLVNVCVGTTRRNISTVLGLYDDINRITSDTRSITGCVNIPVIHISRRVYHRTIHGNRHVNIVTALPAALRPAGNAVLHVTHRYGERIRLISYLISNTFNLSRSRFGTHVARVTNAVTSGISIVIFTRNDVTCYRRCVTSGFNGIILDDPHFNTTRLGGTLRGGNAVWGEGGDQDAEATRRGVFF